MILVIVEGVHRIALPHSVYADDLDRLGSRPSHCHIDPMQKEETARKPVITVGALERSTKCPASAPMRQILRIE
jgi:hypothetical protein